MNNIKSNNYILELIAKLLVLVIAVCILGVLSKPTMAANSLVNKHVYGLQEKQVYWLDVNQDTQLVKVMEGKTPIRIIIVSTGKSNTPTPNGTFYTQNKGPFFSVGYASAKYFTSFKGWGKYMFHSILFDSKGKQVIASAAEKLGTKASHGCIRMPIHDAYWIYRNIPQGTKVIIHSQGPIKKQGLIQLATPKKNSFKIYIDGKVLKLSKKSRWVEGILMVPINDLVKLMNIKTVWNSKEVSITIVRNGNITKLPMSIPGMTVNGKPKTLQIPALLINQTIWVPFADTLTSQGYQIEWSARDNLVSASSPNYSKNVGKPQPANN